MVISRLARRVGIISTLVVVLTAAGGLVWGLSDPLHAGAHRKWASRAITMIQQRSSDQRWLQAEHSRLIAVAARQPHSGGWVGDELLVMKNGQWMICQNVCTKEEHTPVRRDIFIGFASDGRWYYSTFHFCVGKCVLQMESQPDSLPVFVAGYWLVPFDGNPENCLEETWFHRPFGTDGLVSNAPIASASATQASSIIPVLSPNIKRAN